MIGSEVLNLSIRAGLLRTLTTIVMWCLKMNYVWLSLLIRKDMSEYQKYEKQR